MRSARISTTRRRRISSPRDLDEEFQDLSISSSSRPSTQESKRSSYSRLSTDSGEGSLEDFSRRNSSPVFFSRDGPNRRHTAPQRKSFSPTNDEDQANRPNTVHALDGISPRCSFSRYAPLPAIGSKHQHLGLYELDRAVPVRRQCFMGPLDIDMDGKVNPTDIHEDITDIHEHLPDINDNETSEDSGIRPVFSVTLDTDTDSDFEDESEVVTQGESDLEEPDSRRRRPIIRSATFTIEKERPDVHGPFLNVAVRLPNGIRVAKRFDCKETLQNVCAFALQNMEEAQSTKWSLVTTDFPKRMFKDLTMSLKEAEIDDKSLLYLQCQDDSDSD